MQKVKDREYLYKDARSNAIVNCDRVGLEQAKRQKQQALARINKEKELENKVAQLEVLIKQLINNQANDNND